MTEFDALAMRLMATLTVVKDRLVAFSDALPDTQHEEVNNIEALANAAQGTVMRLSNAHQADARTLALAREVLAAWSARDNRDAVDAVDAMVSLCAILGIGE